MSSHPEDRPRRCRVRGCPAWLGAIVMAMALASAAPDARNASGQAPGQLDWVEGLGRAYPVPAGPAGQAFPWDNQYGRIRSTFTQGGITAAEGRAWDEQMRAIAGVLKATPVVSASAGFFPELTGFVSVLNVGTFVDRPKQAPLVGGVTLSAWPPGDVEVDPAGRPTLKRGAHIRSFRLELNYVYPPPRDGWMSDAAGAFAPLVRQGAFAGFPLHGNSLVITRDGRLPFVPVSRRRALEAYIAHLDKVERESEAPLAERRRQEYAEFVSPEGRARRSAAIDAEVAGAHPTAAEQVRRRAEAIDRRRETDLAAAAAEGPGPVARVLAEARGQLAALGEADGQAPAWRLPSLGKNLVEVVPPGTPGASPLVAFDEDFFDVRQPRHTLRIALVRELHNIVDGAERGTASDRIGLQVLQQVDWRAFADRFLR